MLGTGALALAFFVLVIAHCLMHTRAYGEVFPVVAFHLCGLHLSVPLFFVISLGLPMLFQYVLVRDLQRKPHAPSWPLLKKYYCCMILSSTVMYLFDILQDAFAARGTTVRRPKTPEAYLKYIMHILLSPLFFMDIVYNLVVDRRRSTGGQRFSCVLFLVENFVVLVYIAYAVAIFVYFYHRPGVAIMQTVSEHRPYFTFQLFSCAIILFSLVLLIEKIPPRLL